VSELKINFKYEHGSADTGKLDLYDASVALNGISRSLSIITHAYINGEGAPTEKQRGALSFT